MSLCSISWILQQPSFNTTGIETDPTITADSSGFLYVAYATNGTVSGQTSTGDYDIVVLKLSNSGVVQWVAQQPTFNTTSLDRYPSIGHDGNGNSYVVYYTQGVASGQTMTGSKGNVVVFKLDSSGLCQWVTQQPTFNRDTDDVDPSIAVDSTGNTYVTYCANGTNSPEQYEDPPLLTVTFSDPPYTTLTMSSGDSHWQAFVPFDDLILKSYGSYIDCSSGQFNYRLYRGLGTTGTVEDISPTFGFITSGYQWQNTTVTSPPTMFFYQYYTLQVICTCGTVDLAYSSYPQQIYPYGRTDFDLRSSVWFEVYTTQPIADLVTFKLDTNGALLWKTEQPPLYNAVQLSPSMVIDSIGCSYIAFYTDGATSGQINTGGYDIAIIKLDSSGIYQWASQKSTFNTPSDDVNPSLACDLQNNLYVAYQTNGVASGQTVTGTSDIVVFKLNSSGETQWVSQQSSFNASGANTAPAIAFGPSGYVYVVYQTTGAVSGQISTGEIDVVYVVFDGSGLVQQADQMGFNTSGNDTQPDLVVDTNGVSYVVYTTTGTASGQTFTGASDLVIFSLTPYFPIIIFNSYTGYLPPSPVVGTPITYTYDVGNIGNVSVTCSVLDHSTTITLGYIPISGSTTATSVYNLIQDDFDLGYVATQAVATAISFPVTTQASLTINLPQDILRPIVSDYYGDVVAIYAPDIYQGDTIVYTYEITNSGNVTLSSGVITNNIGIPILNVGNIPVGVTTYTNAYILTQNDINQGSITSQTLVSGRFGSQRLYSLPVTTVVTITQSLSIDIWLQSVEFIPSGMVVIVPGTQMIVTYGISNYSNVPLSNCAIVDNTTHTGGLGTIDSQNAGYLTNPYPYLVTQDDIVNEEATITASGVGLWGIIPVTSNITVTVPISIVCQMSLFYGGAVSSYPVVYGEPVTYYICAQNTGNVPLQNTLISSTLGYSTTITTTINVGQTQVVSYTYLVTSGDLVAGGIISTATASGEYPPLYANTSATSSVPFSVSQPLWLQQQPVFNTTGNDVTPSIAVDNSGHVYVAYATNGVASGQTLTGSSYNIVVFKLQHQSMDQWSLQWITEQPSFNTDATNIAPSLVVDESGNSYIAYCGDGVASGQTNTGSYDIVVFKLSTSGEVQWVTQQPDFNTSLIDLSPAMALDTSGNLHVTYMTTGTIPGGEHPDQTYTDTLRYGTVTYGGSSYYIFGSGTDGAWQSFTAPGDGVINSYGFECQNAGYSGDQIRINLYTGEGIGGVLIDTHISQGVFGWLMFTPSGGTCTITSGQKYTIQVFNIDIPLFGGYAWWVSDGQGTYAGGTNNIVPAETLTFDVQMLLLLPYYSVVAFELDNTGTLQWATQLSEFNTDSDDLFPTVIVDADGNTYVAYYTTGTISGGSNLGEDDIVVFKLDASGNTVWTQQQIAYNTTGDDLTPSIGIDTSGNVYIAYQTSGLASGQTLTGVYDIVLFKINSVGDLIWITQQPTFNTTQSNIQPRLTVDLVGNVYITYTTNGTVSGQTNLGGYDIVIVKFDTNGEVKWITQQPSFNTTANDTNPVIAVDSFKNLYVSYQTTGTASNQTNAGGSDLVVFILNPFDMAITIDSYDACITDFENRILTYTYQLSNTGTRVLTNVTVYDNLVGTVLIGTLLPNQTTTKTEPYQLTVTNLVDKYVLNQMYVTATSITATLTTTVTTITTYLPQPEIPLQTWIHELTTSGDNTQPQTTYTQGLYVSYTTTGISSGQVKTGNPDLVLCKFNARGAPQWNTQTGSFNTPLLNQSPALTGDSSGNVYLAYQTNGTMYPLVNLDGYEQIVAGRFNSQGTTQWLEQRDFQYEGYSNENPAITVDTSGNTYISYVADTYVYVSKIDEFGQTLWMYDYLDGPDCWTPSIAVDYLSNIYCAYTSSGSVIVVSKLDSDGNLVFYGVVVSDPLGYSINPAIAVDGSGNSYIAFQTELGPSQWDIVVTSVDTNGLIRWTTQQEAFNPHTNSTDPQITLDTSGNVTVCYSTNGVVDDPYNSYITMFMVVFRLDTNGNFIWVLQNSSSPWMSLNTYPTITNDNQGSLYLTNQRIYFDGNGDPFGQWSVEVLNLTLTPAIITLSTSGIITSSGYNLYTYLIGNESPENLDGVTINDTLGASGLLGTIVPTGTVTITFLHATPSGTTSTATAIGLYSPLYLSHLAQPWHLSPYYVSSQQTVTI